MKLSFDPIFFLPSNASFLPLMLHSLTKHKYMIYIPVLSSSSVHSKLGWCDGKEWPQTLPSLYAWLAHCESAILPTMK